MADGHHFENSFNCISQPRIIQFRSNLVRISTLRNGHLTNKKLSWCWQQARRVERSVKVNKHGTIPHVTY